MNTVHSPPRTPETVESPINNRYQRSVNSKARSLHPVFEDESQKNARNHSMINVDTSALQVSHGQNSADSILGNPPQSQKKERPICSHVVDRCYPQGYKGKQPNSMMANATVSDTPTPPSSDGLTASQIQQLVSFLSSKLQPPSFPTPQVHSVSVSEPSSSSTICPISVSDPLKTNQESLQEQKNVIYKTKQITFLGRAKQIVLKNENVPSPLIAICNVLLLRDDMNLDPHQLEVSQANLLNLVANTMIEFTSDVTREERKFILDAISLLPCLADGFHLDIKFMEIDDFKSTPELAIFESLMIPLYHGWTIESMDFETAAAIGGKCYGDLLSAFVSPSIQNELEPEKVELILEFLTSNQSQLTVTGLNLLQARLLDCELCVFFRNNHFLTMLKYDEELYQLVTDQRFLRQPSLVWKKVVKDNRDSVFMTGNFKVFHSQKRAQQKADYIFSSNSSWKEGMKNDHDHKTTMELQQQELAEATNTEVLDN